MDFRAHAVPASSLSTMPVDALLVIVAGDELAAGFDASIAATVRDAVTAGDFEFKAGKSLYVHRPSGVTAPRLLIVATGAATPKAFKSAVVAAFGQLKSMNAAHVGVAVSSPGGLQADHVEQVICAASDAVYVYRETKPSAPKDSAMARISIACERADERVAAAAVAVGRAVAAGVGQARDCANLPSNVCTPTYLAETARTMGKEFGFQVEILDRKELEKIGMGSFLAVAQGSDEPPKFIVARYQGAGKKQPPVVLVGKGITFDTGGISIKPSADMDEMKFDMGGAASVLGTLRAIAQLKPKLNLVCLIPSCENMPSGTAMKPGDVVTSLSGQTIEILNTDAEGRLILCDALTYAERFKPALVIDVATLTGACVVALGHVQAGLFTDDDELAGELLKAGRSALDPCWRMPLDEEYDDGLKSNFADMANIGPRVGGAITAAMFLRRYTKAYRWAHLDIAGVAWKSGAQKGSTGRPVPLLTRFLLARAS